MYDRPPFLHLSDEIMIMGIPVTITISKTPGHIIHIM